MKINRTKLLDQLESVAPGLAVKENIEQSNRFVFNEGAVTTFNDDIACSITTELDCKAAVEANSFLSLLQKLKDDEVEVELAAGELRVSGKNRKAGFRVEEEIRLPIEAIEPAEKWSKVPEDFCQAISIVENCADNKKYDLSCLHLTKDFLEACDGRQLARYQIKLPIKKPVLIQQKSLSHIAKTIVTRMSETKRWIHFKSKAGVVFSCRKTVEKYPDLSEVVAWTGPKVVLPKLLGEIVERAEIFSSEKTENRVLISLSKDKLIMEGSGLSGWYKERKKVKYNGKNISFRIPPALLQEVSKRSNQCQVTEKCLKVVGDNYTYITALFVK
jgi:DNA polymerase III sliding clamp (beta) subunit (PCNA family)